MDSIATYTNMAKAIKWQIPFASLSGTLYRIDIYAEGYSGDPIQLTAGESPFVTEEDSSEDFFAPIRTQTGSIQVCTRKPDGTMLTLDEILPANNIDHPVRLLNISDQSNPVIEWQGFLSCEAYSQNYTSIPENLTLSVISVLEAMKSVELSYYLFDQIGSETIGDFIDDILDQVHDDMGMQISTVYSQSSSDILSKYIFVNQFFEYKTEESTGNQTYIYTAKSLCEILEDICKFMGWCLREVADTFYFMRLGSDELGMTTADMADLDWRGTDHKRDLRQGASKVSVEAKVEPFKTYFEMPICPYTGLTQKNAYQGWWYYDKCTQAIVEQFTSYNVAKCFLARFYGLTNDSVFPWELKYSDIGFNNAIYVDGKKYEDSSYSARCKIHSILDFSVICPSNITLADYGYFVLKIKDEKKASYLRVGLKFGAYYYTNTTPRWIQSDVSFKLTMNEGSGELYIPMPKIRNIYTLMTAPIELYIYDDFDNGGTSAILSEISINFEPPVYKNNDDASSNNYVSKTQYDSRDEISISLGLASSFQNKNALSHIYGVKRYTYGQEYVDYLEPITTLTYDFGGSSTISIRPEVDLLNRLAAYYGASRQTLDLITKHPTAAVLPLLKLNGINDGKTYLPLSESRDWRNEECTLKCFEMPNTSSES